MILYRACPRRFWDDESTHGDTGRLMYKGHSVLIFLAFRRWKGPGVVMKALLA